MAKNDHCSIYDPIRPEIDPTRAAPYYEDRVLLRRLPWPEEERGLTVPEIAKPVEGNQFGEVVAVGKGASTFLSPFNWKEKPFRNGKRFPPIVKVGDRVIFKRSEVNEFRHNNETYVFLFEEQSIEAIVEA